MAEPDEIPLQEVTLTLCQPCLDGEGGQCHSPGCALWMTRAPDTPVTQHLGEAEAMAAHERFQQRIRAGDGPAD